MKIDLNKYNWEDIQTAYDTGLNTTELCKKFNITRHCLIIAAEQTIFKPRTTSESMRMVTKSGKRDQTTEWTPERRKAQSERKKKLYQEHPEKHPNRKMCDNHKKLTYPEKLAYEFFKINNISFQSHIPIKFETTNYWPDFIINNTLIIEIDGKRWHSSKEQKEYDDKRDKNLESLGYKVLRVPAKNILINLKNIFNGTNTESINIEELKTRIIEIPKYEKPKTYCVNCNKETKYSKTGFCNTCIGKVFFRTNAGYVKKDNDTVRFSNGKTTTVDELKKLIEEISMNKIGSIFGVTDNCVRKKCKIHNIKIPRRKGDWVKTVLNEKILKLHSEKKSIEEISQILNINSIDVNHIINRKTRKHRERHPPLDNVEIIGMYCDGYSDRDLAKKFNCKRSHIQTIIKEWIKHYQI